MKASLPPEVSLSSKWYFRIQQEHELKILSHISVEPLAFVHQQQDSNDRFLQIDQEMHGDVAS